MDSRDRPRPDQFLRDAQAIYTPEIRRPDSSKDFGTYEQMERAFDGLLEFLEDWRRNYGRVGYGAVNQMSDLQKDCIARIQDGEDDNPAYAIRAMETVFEGFVEDGSKALPDHVDRFESMLGQEYLEGVLFDLFWPVVVGKASAVPQIPAWKSFKGNLQAYLYGFIDVVTELAKAVDDELAKPDMTTDREFETLERYLAIADSIILALSTLRHSPGYVINNGFGRWVAFSNKLYSIQGAVKHVQRNYSLRRSTQRMIRDEIAALRAVEVDA